MSKKQSTPPDFRSAKTGRFVSERYARKHPATTVKEHNAPSKKGR